MSDQAVKQVQMATMIPANEEPVIAVQVIRCKSGQIYVGYNAVQEQAAHALLLGGVGTLYAAQANRLAEHKQTRIVPAGANLLNDAQMLKIIQGKRDS